jgi:hypothetical protein
MGWTGRILLIAVLAFGGLYYYETSETARQKESFNNQLLRDEIARKEVQRERDEREEKLEREEFARQTAEFKRTVERDYRRCFGRPMPKPYSAMDPKERADLVMVLYRRLIPHLEAVCDR